MKRSRERRSATAATVAGASRGASLRVLFPVTEGVSDRALTVARDVAAAGGGSLLLLDADSETVTARDPDDGDAAPETLLDGIPDAEVATDASGVGACPFDAVIAAAADHEVDLVVVEDGGGRSRVRRSPARRIGERVDCDALVISQNSPTPSIASVLVPVGDGPDAAAALDVATAIARENDAWIELMRVCPDDDAARTNARALLERHRSRVGGDVDAQTWLIDDGDVRETIVEQSAHYDVTVLGTSRDGRLRRMLFGALSDAVRTDADNTVLVTRQGEDGPLGS